MTVKIEKTLSRTGSRVMFFPTVDGLRITRTNFARKYSAVALGRLYLAQVKTAVSK